MQPNTMLINSTNVMITIWGGGCDVETNDVLASRLKFEWLACVFLPFGLYDDIVDGTPQCQMQSTHFFFQRRIKNHTTSTVIANS